MTIEEIFKDNPSLLETKEVKILIDYAEEIMARNVKICRKHESESFAINDVIMYSNRMLIKGYSDKETVDKIQEILNG